MAFFDFVLDPTSETGAFLYLTNDWIIDTDEEDGEDADDSTDEQEVDNPTD